MLQVPTMERAPSAAVVPAADTVRPLNEGAAKASKVAEEARIDADLVERIRAGDQAAFRQLFDRYHRRTYAVALGIVKNPQDAMDVVQDAFIKVHKHIDGFHGSSSFYTWLYRIVMNLAIDHVRRVKKTTEYDDQAAQSAAAMESDLLPRQSDANPGKVLARQEIAVRIREALDELPEYHRAVILLREVQGCSYEEMAKILKVPKGTIMSRLFHARRKMQERLQGYLQGELEIED